MFDTSSLCSDLGLCDIVQAPTCNGSCLDKILVSDSLAPSASTSVTAPIANSDHNSVSATLNYCLTNNPTVFYNKVFDMRRRFVDRFINDVNSTDFESALNCDSFVDTKCQIFQDTLTNCFNKAIPSKLVPISVRDKPWITPYVKCLIHERWSAYRQRDFVKYRHLSSSC